MSKTLEILVLVAALALSGCQKAENGEKCSAGRVYNTQTEQCEWAPDEDVSDISDVVENEQIDNFNDTQDNSEEPLECGITYCFADEFDDLHHTIGNWEINELDIDNTHSFGSGVLTLENQRFYRSIPNINYTHYFLRADFKVDSYNGQLNIGFLRDNEGNDDLIEISIYEGKMYFCFEEIEEYNHGDWNTAYIKIDREGIFELQINEPGRIVEKIDISNADIDIDYKHAGFECIGEDACMLDLVVYGVDNDSK
jgi:hypothetical protein